MRTTWIIILASIASPGLVLGQNGYHEVRQLRPELCGKPGGTVSLPPDFSVTFDQDGEAQLFARSGAPGIHLDYLLYGIEEVCPISDGRIVVFGDANGGTSFYVLDRAHSSQLDTVITYDAFMSPDQRWIVYRKFFPRTTDLPASDEYLLYDLSKSPAQNRPAGNRSDPLSFDVGKAIYPPGWKNEPFDNIGAPENQRHGHLSPFFWTPDSRAIVFGDELKTRNIVLIRIDEHSGGTAAFVYPFPERVACGPPGPAEMTLVPPTGLRNVEFGPPQASDRLIFIDFEAAGCNPAQVQIHADAFIPARVEKRVLEKPTRKAKLADGQVPR